MNAMEGKLCWKKQTHPAHQSLKIAFVCIWTNRAIMYFEKQQKLPIVFSACWDAGFKIQITYSFMKHWKISRNAIFIIIPTIQLFCIVKTSSTGARYSKSCKMRKNEPSSTRRRGLAGD